MAILMASKCQCCAQVETMEHVFFSNPIANQVWGHFANLIGKRQSSLFSLQQMVTNWSLSVSTRGHIRQVLPLVILWALWEARNRAKHLAVTYSLQQIISRITYLLGINAKANMKQAKFWTGDEFLGVQLEASVEIQPHPVLTLQRWERPQHGQLKLNIDAAFKENKAGYGGIVRDCRGALILAMGAQGRCNSALQAELEALLYCLRCCVARGLSQLHIEVDSLILVNLIKEQQAHWELIGKVVEIAALLSSSGSKLVHIYRERNMAADWLAKKAWKEQNNCIWEANTTDKGIQGLIQLEQSGLPQIRLRS